MAKAGYAFAPTDAGMTRSNRTGWQLLATDDVPTIEGWLDNGDSLVSVARKNHQYILDIDDVAAAVAAGLKLAWLDGTYLVDTPGSGIHASGIHDAISNALPNAFMNVRLVKNDSKSKLIVELKLDRCSTAAPSAERYGVRGKKDGVYQSRFPFTGTVTGINPDLLVWVKANMDDKAPASMHSNFMKFHPAFDLERFLDNECSSEFASGMVNNTYHVVLEECPICGKPAVKSTLRAGISKSIFGGKGVGYICHACDINTYKDYVEEMVQHYTDYERWPKDNYIYPMDDPKLLAARFPVDDVSNEPDEVEPVPAVDEEDEPIEDIYKADTKGLERMGSCADEDGEGIYTFYAQTADQIKLKRMTWLWPEKVPAGMLVIISGKPDSGKTLCLIDWLARVTTGGDWPDGSKNIDGPKRVMFCSAEDDPERTTKPRLMAAGCDLKKVIIPKITYRPKDSQNEVTGHLNIKRDLFMIAEILKKNRDISVLVLDPITSYLGGANINKDEEIRPLFDKLIVLGQKMNLTILALVHSNKRSDVDAVEKVMGASSVAGAARAVWTFAKDTEDETLYRMGLAKGNVIKKKGGFEFHIVDAEVTIDGYKDIHPKIVWGKETNLSANAMLQADRQRARGGDTDSVLTLAKAIIRETVPGFATEVFKKAEQEGVNERAIYRANKELGIKSDKSGGRAFWYYPGQKGDPTIKAVDTAAYIPEEAIA